MDGMRRLHLVGELRAIEGAPALSERGEGEVLSDEAASVRDSAARRAAVQEEPRRFDRRRAEHDDPRLLLLRISLLVEVAHGARSSVLHVDLEDHRARAHLAPARGHCFRDHGVDPRIEHLDEGVEGARVNTRSHTRQASNARQHDRPLAPLLGLL